MATMDVMARLKADASGWVAGFKQAEASARRTATAATAASSKAQAAQKRQASAVSGGGLVALAAAAAIGAYGVAAVKAFTDTAASAVKVRRVMGGSIESASAYGAAAKLAGVDTEQFTKSLGLFDKKLVAANDNGGKAAEMTAKLGTSFTNTDGSVKNLSAILPAVADKFQSMKDGPEEAALALQLFGRAGTQMLPFLNRGSAGIQDLLTKARQLGLVIDEQGVAKLSAYRTAQRDFQGAMQGLQVTLGSELLPSVTSAFGALGSLAQVFGKIPGPIKTATVAVVGFAAAASLLGPRISVLGGYVGGIGKSAAGAVRGLASLGGAIKALATGSLVADAAVAGLSTATGAAGTSAAAAGTGLAGASGAVLAFAAAAAAVGMGVSYLVGKFNATKGAAGTMASTFLGLTGVVNPLALAFAHATSGVENFGHSDVPIDAVAESLKKLNDQPQQLAAAWSRMTQGMSGDEVNAAKDKLTELGVAFSDVADGADEAATAQAELSSEISKYQSLTAQSTAVSFRQDLAQLKESLSATNGVFNNSKAGLENQSKALSMASGMARSYDQQMKQLADAGQEGSAAADQVSAAYVRQMTQLAQTIPRTQAGKQAIDGINQAMAAVPGWKPINVTTPGASQAQTQLASLAAKVNMTPKQLRVAISQAGADPTGAKIAALARRLGTTPKKLRLLIEAIGGDKAIGDAAKAGSQAGKKLGDGAKAGKGQAKAAGRGVGAAIAEGGKAATAQAGQAGQTVGAALNTGAVVGIQSTLGAAIGAATAAGAQVAQAYKDAAKTHSPSVFGIEVGEGLNDGVLVGIGSTAARTLAGVRAMATRIGTTSGEAAARAKARADAKASRDLDKKQEAMNKQGLTKKEKKAGKSSGRGDLWRAEQDAARDYWKQVADDAAQAAQKIEDDAASARDALLQLRESTTLQLRDSGRGDVTQAKTAGSAKSWLTNQLKTVLNFNKNLQTLAAKGLPQGMLQQIISKGLDGAPLAASLVKANLADFNQIAATAAALDTASLALGNTGAGLFMDRPSTAGVTANQNGPMAFTIYIGNQQVNELVGAEVNGQVAQIVNRMVYR